MKEIRLVTLKIENFKGIRLLELSPDGQSMSIYGDNATGKSTIYDAFLWLLFGKTRGGGTRCQIKPLGADGKPREAGVIPTVTAVLSVNGEHVTLRRAYREKWERVRGSADQVLSGHTTDYTVDGVPRQENAYRQFIDELVDEDTFRQLTNVHYFCGVLPWQERRKRLFALSSIKSDQEILEAAPVQFDLLKAELGRRTIEEFKEILEAQRRSAKNELNALPVRIDECEKTLEEIGTPDYITLRATEADLNARRAEQQAALLKLENNTLLAEKQAARDALRNTIRQLELDNAEHRQSQKVPVFDERPAARAEIEQLRRQLAASREERTVKQAAIERLQAAIAACKQRWHEIHAQVFTDDGLCKLCGQPLPAEQLTEARTQFQRRKLAEEQAAVDEATAHKTACAQAEEALSALETQIAQQEEAIAQAQARLDAMTAPAQPVITDLPDFHAQYATHKEKLAEHETKIAALRDQTASVRQEIQDNIRALENGLHAVRAQLATESTLLSTQRRIAALHEEQRKQAAFQENAERKIELCEDFVRYKVQSIDEQVNSRFKMLRFALYDDRINGNLRECCNALAQGIPYNDDNLNDGARINAGMDVIRVLSEHFEIRVPLFIDNAESVTELYPLDTQVIRLVVSAQDKELRCSI